MSGKAAGVAAAQQIAQALDSARVHYQRGQLRDAERICRTVVAQRPQHVAALTLLGFVLGAANRAEEAVRYLHAAALINPVSPAGHRNEGMMLASLGHHAEAITCLDRCIALDPRDAAALANRGASLHALGRHADAVASCEMALQIAPGNVEALTTNGMALHRLDRVEEALTCFERALAIRPDDADLANRQGDALATLGRFDEAIACFRRALVLVPDHVDALANLANTLCLAGHDTEALVHFAHAQALAPDFAKAHFGAALCRLAMGDFAQGWRDYEWRWEAPAFHAMRRDIADRLWRGGPEINGKTILLSAEQGFGDTLQFCRYAPLLKTAAAVVLEVQGPLVRLLTTLPGVSQVIAKGDSLPDFDLMCPLMSLPLACGTTLATIPNQVPYLHADPDQVAVWRQRLANSPGLRVGLVWSGLARPHDPAANRINHRRSTTLDRFTPLGELPHVRLISLQKGLGAAQTKPPPPGLAIADWTDELDDFADTAALIEALDLVISVDTSVAHLAGALGKPVWVLNRFDACWRWLRDHSDSPWYPTARLFRQPSPGDWASVIAEVGTALRQWAP